jgi:hypothetical protein
MCFNQVEVQFLQSHYDVMLGPFSDYLELIIQVLYCALMIQHVHHVHHLASPPRSHRLTTLHPQQP